MRWVQTLTKANLGRDPEAVTAIRAEIEEMRGAWVEVNRQVASGQGEIRIFSVPILDGTRSPPGK